MMLGKKTGVLILLFATCFLLLLVSCKEEVAVEMPNIGDTYSEITEEYGSPIDNLGAGVNILVYSGKTFGDDSEVSYILYFSPKNTLTKITQVGKDGNEVVFSE